MARINVYNYGDPESYDYEGPTLAGWFNNDSATLYKENTRWDGNNHISVNTGSQWDHEALYRTKAGRWVLNTWSQWQGSEERYKFVDDATAKDWLIRNDQDEAVAQHFGELEEESGPKLGGRPSIGPKVEVRLPQEVLDRVEALRGGRERADVLRDLITAGLDVLSPAQAPPTDPTTEK